MKKIMMNRIGIALILVASLLVVAPLAIAADADRPAKQPNALDVMAPVALGTFNPITPCRAVDTRFSSGWGYAPMYSGETRDIWLWGGLGWQGGVAGDCVPSYAQAVAVNLAAVPVSGCGGVMTVWKYGTSRPNASVMNYSACINQAALSNGFIVEMAPDNQSELNIWNNWGTTHFVLDVMGYWY